MTPGDKENTQKNSGVWKILEIVSWILVSLLNVYFTYFTLFISVQAEFKKIGAPTFLGGFGLNFHMTRHFYL